MNLYMNGDGDVCDEKGVINIKSAVVLNCPHYEEKHNGEKDCDLKDFCYPSRCLEILDNERRELVDTNETFVIDGKRKKVFFCERESFIGENTRKFSFIRGSNSGEIKIKIGKSFFLLTIDFRIEKSRYSKNIGTEYIINNLKIIKKSRSNDNNLYKDFKCNFNEIETEEIKTFIYRLIGNISEYKEFMEMFNEIS